VTTDLLVRKREIMFSKLDTDNDGAIDEKDIQAHIADFLTQFGVSPSSSLAQEIRELGDRFWQELSQVDTDGNRVITKEAYVGSIDDDLVELIYVHMNVSFFKIVDSDGDGLITEEELVEALSKVGLAAEDVRNAFQELDADNDGHISKEEWGQAVREMLLSSDPRTPGSLLLGM
jgi:Ca2+-binding EF-hand superfamily protein